MTANPGAGLAARRIEMLRDLVRQEGAVRLGHLSRRLGVSAATVRRDLAALEAQGRIRRVHGGAVSVESRLEEPLFDDKAGMAAGEKRRIAEAALALVASGTTVYLDGGSTVLEVARLLADRGDVTVVTNSLRAALELSHRGPRVIVVGGQLRRLSQTLVGALSRPMLENLHVDLALMGTVGLTDAEGATTTDPDEAFTKREVQSRAGVVALLADRSKLGRISFARTSGLQDIDVLITDRGADPGILRALRKRVRKVMVV